MEDDLNDIQQNIFLESLGREKLWSPEEARARWEPQLVPQYFKVFISKSCPWFGQIRAVVVAHDSISVKSYLKIGSKAHGWKEHPGPLDLFPKSRVLCTIKHDFMMLYGFIVLRIPGKLIQLCSMTMIHVPLIFLFLRSSRTKRDSQYLLCHLTPITSIFPQEAVLEPLINRGFL